MIWIDGRMHLFVEEGTLGPMVILNVTSSSVWMKVSYDESPFVPFVSSMRMVPPHLHCTVVPNIVCRAIPTNHCTSINTVVYKFWQLPGEYLDTEEFVCHVVLFPGSPLKNRQHSCRKSEAVRAFGCVCVLLLPGRPQPH